MLQPCRVTTRMTGMNPPAGGFSPMEVLSTFPTGPMRPAGELLQFRPDNLDQILCGPLICDPRRPAFLEATFCSKNTAELNGFPVHPKTLK